MERHWQLIVSLLLASNGDFTCEQLSRCQTDNNGTIGRFRSRCSTSSMRRPRRAILSFVQLLTTYAPARQRLLAITTTSHAVSFHREACPLPDRHETGSLSCFCSATVDHMTFCASFWRFANISWSPSWCHLYDNKLSDHGWQLWLTFAYSLRNLNMHIHQSILHAKCVNTSG